jgi:hypothetical protein
MISYLRGSFKGKKLAEETGNLCKEITNYLILNNLGVQLQDTAYIFQESYTLCSLLNTKQKMNRTVRGVIIKTSKSILREWLLKVFEEANKDLDYTEGVDEIINKFPQYTLGWTKELTNKHSNMVGQNLDRWAPVICTQFIDNIHSYIEKEFGRVPDNYKDTMMNILIRNVKKLSAPSSS